MPMCAVCDVELKPEQKTCHVCGSNVEAAPSGIISPSIVPLPTSSPVPTQSAEPVATTTAAGTDDRECPACGQAFGADYQDEFCPCGSELRAKSESKSPFPTGPILPPPIPASSESTGAARPAAGTICLVVYSDSKPRQPIRYLPIVKDVLLIGREDAIRGDFPDLDLSSLLDESLAKKVSRRHAEILRARDSQTFRLRPLPGNTGTQVGKELATPGQEYPLTDGTPIVLGGVVWMKFESIK